MRAIDLLENYKLELKRLEKELANEYLIINTYKKFVQRDRQLELKLKRKIIALEVNLNGNKGTVFY